MADPRPAGEMRVPVLIASDSDLGAVVPMGDYVAMQRALQATAERHRLEAAARENELLALRYEFDAYRRDAEKQAARIAELTDAVERLSVNKQDREIADSDAYLRLAANQNLSVGNVKSPHQCQIIAELAIQHKRVLERQAEALSRTLSQALRSGNRNEVVRLTKCIAVNLGGNEVPGNFGTLSFQFDSYTDLEAFQRASAPGGARIQVFAVGRKSQIAVLTWE